MIIDFHCHAGLGDRLTAPWDTAARIGTYLRRAREAGIDRTVVLPTGSTDYARSNEEMGRIVARHHGRLIGFASVHARRDAGRVASMLECAVRTWGARGLKVHGYDATPTREVCDAARDLGLPMLVDVVGKAHIVDLLASEYPDVDFVIPHLGSFQDDFRAQQQVVDQLVRLPNVYADTAGVRRFDYLVQAIRRAGPHKLLFGSDGPWLHPALELHKIRLLRLSPKDEALVMGGNAMRLFHRGAARREARAITRDSGRARRIPSGCAAGARR